MPQYKKVYGSYKTDWCPYCGKKALHKGQLGFCVCKDHKDTQTDPALRSPTGELLEVRYGKFGNYCFSFKRGNISIRDALEMNGKTCIE